MPVRSKKLGLTIKSFTYAIVIHAFIGALLLTSFNTNLSKVSLPSAKQQPEPVQAMVLTEADLKKQMDIIEHKEEKKKLEQKKAEKRLEDLLAQTKEAKKKQKQEEQKLAEIKKEQEQQKKKAEQKKKKLADEKKKKLVDEKKKKKELAKKKEKERLTKVKKEEERKRKEAEKKKKAELARKKKLEEEKRAKELALQQRLEEERTEAALAQYVPIIRQKVGRNWNQPVNVQSGITASVLVKLSVTGEVLSATVTRSSGNSVFDRSVENAVYKASPLPIPQERGVNERFRNLNLKFKPEDLFS